MSTKIPLPSATRLPNAKAHSFPLQVAYQTHEFLPTVLFYAMFADTAAGEYVRLPNALNQIEKVLIQHGMDKKEWTEDGIFFRNTCLSLKTLLSKTS